MRYEASPVFDDFNFETLEVIHSTFKIKQSNFERTQKNPRIVTTMSSDGSTTAIGSRLTSYFFLIYTRENFIAYELEFKKSPLISLNKALYQKNYYQFCFLLHQRYLKYIRTIVDSKLTEYVPKIIIDLEENLSKLRFELAKTPFLEVRGRNTSIQKKQVSGKLSSIFKSKKTLLWNNETVRLYHSNLNSNYCVLIGLCSLLNHKIFLSYSESEYKDTLVSYSDSAIEYYNNSNKRNLLSFEFSINEILRFLGWSVRQENTTRVLKSLFELKKVELGVLFEENEKNNFFESYLFLGFSYPEKVIGSTPLKIIFNPIFLLKCVYPLFATKPTIFKDFFYYLKENRLAFKMPNYSYRLFFDVLQIVATEKNSLILTDLSYFPKRLDQRKIFAKFLLVTVLFIKQHYKIFTISVNDIHFTSEDFSHSEFEKLICLKQKIKTLYIFQ